MKQIGSGLKIIVATALFVAGLCSCASTEGQKSATEKQREAWYSSYVDNTNKNWSMHL
jgi:hypothetical protein